MHTFRRAQTSNKGSRGGCVDGAHRSLYCTAGGLRRQRLPEPPNRNVTPDSAINEHIPSRIVYRAQLDELCLFVYPKLSKSITSRDKEAEAVLFFSGCSGSASDDGAALCAARPGCGARWCSRRIRPGTATRDHLPRSLSKSTRLRSCPSCGRLPTLQHRCNFERSDSR